jgi:hypothetical protein
MGRNIESSRKTVIHSVKGECQRYSMMRFEAKEWYSKCLAFLTAYCIAVTTLLVFTIYNL